MDNGRDLRLNYANSEGRQFLHDFPEAGGDALNLFFTMQRMGDSETPIKRPSYSIPYSGGLSINGPVADDLIFHSFNI
jgi:hypothetical protein